MTLPEALAALTITALGTSVAVPSMTTMLKSWKLTAAARDMAVEMQRARAEAIQKGDYVGILYERGAAGDRWRLYQDGGARGIHAAEIANGIDTPLGATFDLGARYPGVRFGIANGGALPRIPPAAGTLSSSDDPIAFGGSDIFSASPTGETSSGSLYMTDGGDMRAVVVFGATGRIRVWSFERSTGRWRQ
ncbi:MAG TPA: hypothetical protein VFE84_09420 [Patescibacteria group bacterium]|nr:hypothetical protein [Patescibacteria group bacterium]